MDTHLETTRKHAIPMENEAEFVVVKHADLETFAETVQDHLRWGKLRMDCNSFTLHGDTFIEDGHYCQFLVRYYKKDS